MISELNWNSYPPTAELLKQTIVPTKPEDLSPGDVLAGWGLFIVVAREGSILRILNQSGNEVRELISPEVTYSRVYTAGQRDEYAKSLVRAGICPKCAVKLEWAAMAERCPECWTVYVGG